MRYVFRISLMLTAIFTSGWPFFSRALADSVHNMPGIPQAELSNELGSLQKRIDVLKKGDSLLLEDGIHQGPIVIKIPDVKIIGSANTTIRGNDIGSVITVTSDNITIENLSIIQSGNSPVTADSGITVRKAKNISLKNLRITDCLFGIDVQLSQDIILEGNFISSKKFEIGLRGDAIRLWNSSNIDVLNNHWEYSRDAVAWYSKNVSFKNNFASHSRYSIHTMYSKQISINNNEFHHNSVGIFLMYGSDFTIVKNRIFRSNGPTGMGIGLKDSSNVFIQENSILYSTTGILVDSSPFNPMTRNWVHNNTIGHNLKGVVLNNDQQGGEFKSNTFIANIQDVVSENRNTSRGVWTGNFWDTYRGFDENLDGIGDTPHVVHKFGDRILNADPRIDFFYGTFLLALIEFVEKVIHIGKPSVILTDAQPFLTP